MVYCELPQPEVGIMMSASDSLGCGVKTRYITK